MDPKSKSKEVISRTPGLSRRDFLKAAGILTGSALLAACAPDVSKAVTEIPTQTGLNSNGGDIYVAPTDEPTAVPVIDPIVEIRPASGGRFTDIQIALVEYSPELKQWKDGIHRRWKYWGSADIPAVSNAWLIEGKIPLVPVFDPFHPNDASKAWMYIDLPYNDGVRQGDCFTLPWVDGGFQFTSPVRYPTNTDGRTVVEVGQGPNLFTKSGRDEKGRFWYLSSAAGKPVRREVGTDKVLYQLDTAGFWVEPVDRLGDQLDVFYTEQYQVKVEKYGIGVDLVIETDITKQEFPVGLNKVDFPRPEETLAEVILEAYYRSVCRAQGINFSREGFEQYLRLWKEMGQPPAGNMKFDAYWDGEPEMREGEMPVPTKPIRLVFVNRRIGGVYDEGVQVGVNGNDIRYWIYVRDGQIILLLHGHAVRQDNKAIGEVSALIYGLNGLSKSGLSVFARKLITSFDGDGKLVLMFK